MTEEKEVKQLKYAFFSGCNIPVRLPHIEAVSRKVCQLLGIELVDLNFSCCPYMGSVRDIDDLDWLVMAARNLVLAEEAKLPIISLCTGCTMTLTEAKHRLDDRELRDKVNERLSAIGKEYKGKAKVEIFAKVMYDNKDLIYSSLKREIPLTVATHSGCHILQPSSILQFDDSTNPKKLDELVEALGADTIDYRKKANCCGALAFNEHKDASYKIMKDKIDDMGDADCITVLCPSCFSHYDRNQRLAVKQLGGEVKPVIYYTQLLGLALGMDAEEAQLKANRSMSDDLSQKIAEILI